MAETTVQITGQVHTGFLYTEFLHVVVANTGIKDGRVSRLMATTLPQIRAGASHD